MTRAILDTNLLISYLLNPTGEGPPSQVVRGAITGDFVLMMSPQLLRELRRKVTTKPCLVERIPESRLNSFIRQFQSLSEFHDDAEMLYPTVTRNRKVDYLVTNAVIFRADYLVSGDHDLLELGTFKGVRIVSPAGFVERLNQLA